MRRADWLRGPRGMLLGSATVLALLVLYLGLVHRTPSRLLLALGRGRVPLHDYRHFFHPMAERLLSDPTPVDGFLYGPWAALFFVPLGLLPYRASAWLWFACLLLLSAGLAREAARYGAERGPWLALAGVALVVSCYPLLHDLKFGQVSVLVVWLLCACATLYDRASPRAAALCLAFAISFKAYPALFLSHFVFKRDWRFVGWTVGCTLVFSVVVPVIVLGPQQAWAFYAGVASQLDARFGGDFAAKNSQSLAALGERLLLRPIATKSASQLPRALFTALRYALCAVMLWGAYRLSARSAVTTRHAFLWLFLATPFVVTTSWPHYFVYLPLAVAGTLALLPRAELSQVRRRVVLAGALAAAALSNIVFFDAFDDRKLYIEGGVLFAANLAALVALGVVLFARNDARVPRDAAVS